MVFGEPSLQSTVTYPGAVGTRVAEGAEVEAVARALVRALVGGRVTAGATLLTWTEKGLGVLAPLKVPSSSTRSTVMA